MFFAKQTLALTVLFAAALPSFSAPVSISQSLSTRQNQRIPAIGSGPQVAKDGSVILEDEVTVAYDYASLFQFGMILIRFSVGSICALKFLPHRMRLYRKLALQREI